MLAPPPASNWTRPPRGDGREDRGSAKGTLWVADLHNGEKEPLQADLDEAQEALRTLPTRHNAAALEQRPLEDEEVEHARRRRRRAEEEEPLRSALFQTWATLVEARGALVCRTMMLIPSLGTPPPLSDTPPTNRVEPTHRRQPFTSTRPDDADVLPISLLPTREPTWGR